MNSLAAKPAARAPRHIHRSIRTAVIAAALLILCYWAGFAWMVYRSPLPYAAIDLDHDGSVSYTEADYVSSFGMRSIYRQGEECVEYFAEKDGLPLTLVCPGKSQAP